MANDIVINVRADDKASGVLASVEGKAKGLGGALGSAIKTGAAAGGLAIAGLGLASLKMASDFETSFAEVKTLLPGLSEEAFGKLQDDIIAVSKEFGIATDKSIPALYQAISAGVPPGNVVDFMSIAAKASIGGVTDLETAVDGITSVVNAYGDEVIDAQKASDIMFTAVRLGKTDFGQLSSSLFNVIPTAAAAGVSFEDVASQLATITAQGTPTSVATTQIRSALVEAQKGGSNLDKALRELHGKGFADLIASGKTMPEVFETLRQSMPEDDFKNLFGSVEAMNAVLGVTGPNFDAVSSAMDEASNSAGATDAAAAKIQETFSFKMNKAINEAKIFLMELGLEALPHVTKAMEVMVPWLRENIPIAVQAARDAFEDIKPTLKTLGEAFITGMEVIMPLIKDFVGFVVSNKPVLIAAIVAIGVAIVLALGPVSGAALAIAGIITAIGLFKDNSEEIKMKLEEIWGEIKDFLSENWLDIATAASVLFLGPVGLIAMFTNNSFGIRDAIMGVWNDHILPFFASLPGKILDLFVDFNLLLLNKGIDLMTGLFNGIRDTWFNHVRPWLEGLPGFIWDAFKTTIQTTLNLYYNFGKELVKQVAAGVEALADWALGKIGGFFKSLNPFSSPPGAHELPDRYLEYGKTLLKNLAKGVLDTESELMGAMGTVLQVLATTSDQRLHAIFQNIKDLILQQMAEIQGEVADFGPRTPDFGDGGGDGSPPSGEITPGGGTPISDKEWKSRVGHLLQNAWFGAGNQDRMTLSMALGNTAWRDMNWVQVIGALNDVASVVGGRSLIDIFASRQGGASLLQSLRGMIGNPELRALGQLGWDAEALKFDRGGWLMPGLTLARNDTGVPERVLGPGEGGNTYVYAPTFSAATPAEAERFLSWLDTSQRGRWRFAT